MIQGRFGDDDELLFEIELIANDGLELSVDALMDTGFSYWLAMNDQDVQGLGWENVGQRPLRTARGEMEFSIYLGKIRIDNQEFYIPVHAGEETTEILIGRQWLKSRHLIVNISSNILTLG